MFQLKNFMTSRLFVMLLMLMVVGQGYFIYRSFQRHDENHAIKGKSEIQEKNVQYTCPMHTSIKSSHPGQCPICGMNLVKVRNNVPESVDKNRMPAASLPELSDKVNLLKGKDIELVTLSPLDIVKANVQTTYPVFKPVHKEIKAFGTVVYDTGKISKISSWNEGRIEKLYYKAVGDFIKKGSRIADIYSPSLLATQKEYLFIMQSIQDLEKSQYTRIIESYRDTLKVIRQKLKYLGLTDKQIESLKTDRDIKAVMTVYSQYFGTVIEVNAYEGMYVDVGSELYKMADFSTVWIESEVDEANIKHIRLNQPVTISLDAYKDKKMDGKITYIYPFMQDETRTLKIRIRLVNSLKLLKPNMYVETNIRIPEPPKLVIPATAVLFTGDANFVWVESTPGKFQRKEVSIGDQYGLDYEILGGLSIKDKIVITGGFLIDSEAELNRKLDIQGHNHS